MTELTLRQIDKIRALLASAIEAGAIRALDRDTVTAALRDIYDEVLSMPAADPSVSEPTSNTEAGSGSHDDTTSDTTEQEEPQYADAPSETSARERDNGLAEVTVPWAATPPAIPADPEPEQPVVPTETCTAEEPEEAICAEPEEADTEHADEETTAPEEAEEDTEEAVAEEKIEETEKPQHDEADETETTEETVIIAEEEETVEEEPHDPDPVEEITMSAEPILPEPTRMERMLSDDRSLTARLGQERLVAVADELCHGDTETCLDMMEALEATGDFDMAVLYIQEHYPQKSDSRAIDMLVEVLSAKFI